METEDAIVRSHSGHAIFCTSNDRLRIAGPRNAMNPAALDKTSVQWNPTPIPRVQPMTPLPERSHMRARSRYLFSEFSFPVSALVSRPNSNSNDPSDL